MKPQSLLPVMGLLSFLFGCGSDTPYSKKDGDWYFKKDKMSLEAGESLTPINKHFAKSNRTAYYESSMIASDVDVASFEALADHYAKDKNNVWFCDTHRDSREYWLVKRYKSFRIAGADAASFRMLNDDWARDTNLVFNDGVGYKVRDINTYQRIGYQHARDKISGYYLRAEIPGSDGSTFEFVEGNYSKDAKHVYWSTFDSDGGKHPPTERTIVLPGADPGTFVMLEHSYARDANQVYYDGVVLSKNPATFRVLEGDYAVSDSAVFYRGVVMKEADLATFTVGPREDGVTAHDKFGKFLFEKRVQQ